MEPLYGYLRLERNGGWILHNDNTMNTERSGACMGAEPIENAVLAMAYVPMQKFGRLYNNEDALCAGTLFADLDKPFYGKGVKR